MLDSSFLSASFCMFHQGFPFQPVKFPSACPSDPLSFLFTSLAIGDAENADLVGQEGMLAVTRDSRTTQITTISRRKQQPQQNEWENNESKAS